MSDPKSKYPSWEEWKNGAEERARREYEDNIERREQEDADAEYIKSLRNMGYTHWPMTDDSNPGSDPSKVW